MLLRALLYLGLPPTCRDTVVPNVRKLPKKIDGVLTYSTKPGVLITDEDFRNRKYPCHHNSAYLSEKTPFETINTSMVTQVPLDTMHLIDLGVMKKFLFRVITNKVSLKIPNFSPKNISETLLKIRPFISKEFTRKPRSLDEFMNWKATEFRQFLLYTGIVALKEEVHPDIYYEFLLLHCSYRLLCCPKQCSNNIDSSQELLNMFVENFPILFGDNTVTYNVHNLLHMHSTIEQVGNPVKGSAYSFENYLQKLKNCIKKPTKILEQIHRKVVEEEFSIVCADRQLTHKVDAINFKECELTTKSPNNICYVEDNIPIKIESFSQDGKICGRRLHNIRSFYETPCDSISLGIYLVDSEASDVITTFSLADIQCKAVAIPYKENLVLLPLLHGCL